MTYFSQERPADITSGKLTEFLLSLLTAMVIILCFSYAPQSYAGVALGATRVVYPADQKQVKLSVNSNDSNGTYLIQSWVEDDNGKKDGRFVITPPLFMMQGKKENTLRIVDATNNALPQDRESLFWINVKAIPAMDKSKLSENVLQLAIISRIKLLYRPRKLSLPPEKAAEKLTFKRNGNSLILSNPTPYFLTVTELNAGNQALENTLVPPMGTSTVKLPSGASSAITYKTINDYGALTPRIQGAIK